MHHLARKFIAATAVIAGLAFVWYCIRALRGHDLSFYATPRSVAGLILMTGFYLGTLPLDGLAWQRLLQGVGINTSARESTAILGIAQFAKYVPGSVAQYLGRAALALPRGINGRSIAVTTVAEMLLTSCAALAVGIGAGLFSVYGRSIERGSAARLITLAALLVATLIGLLLLRRMLPPLIRRFLPHHADLWRGTPVLPSFREMALAFVLYTGGYALIGIGFARMAHLILPQHIHHDWLLGASFAFAWVIGFLTPVAPAGLGVREALLVLMLAPAYSQDYAIVLVIALRLATTLGDAIMLAAGYLLLPRRKTAAVR